MSSEDWNTVINVNLNSSFHLLKHFTKTMVKKRFGRIVFISSVVAHTGNPGQVNYTATKAAISGLMKSLALELSSKNKLKALYAIIKSVYEQNWCFIFV